MTLEEFIPLHIKYINALGWISAQKRRVGNTLDIQFERDLDDFRQKVERPMDEAWSQLTNEERLKYIQQLGNTEARNTGADKKRRF